jgi:hypothetical protein
MLFVHVQNLHRQLGYGIIMVVSTLPSRVLTYQRIFINRLIENRW